MILTISHPEQRAKGRLGIPSCSSRAIGRKGAIAVWNSQATDPATHEAAVRLAVACRRIVQACLREEEWVEADRQFYRVIREGLERFRTGGGTCTSGTS